LKMTRKVVWLILRKCQPVQKKKSVLWLTKF